MYIVEFENTYGERREIGSAAIKPKANKIIQKFLNSHKYKAPYWRIISLEDNIEQIDVGSHTEFFYIRKEN